MTIEQSMTGIEATNLISGMTYQNISTAIAEHSGAVRFNLYSITEQTQDGLNTVFVASGAPGDPLPSDPNNQYTDWVNASEVNLLGAITDSIVPFNVSYDAVESSQSEFGQAIQMFDNLAVTTSVLSTVGDVNSGSVTGNIGSITFLINDVADADNEFIIIGGQTVALSQTDAMLGNGIELQLGQVVPDPQTRQNDIVYQSVFDANQSTTRAITISGDWSASELNTLLSEARYVASTALVDRSFEIAEIIDAEGDYVRSFNLGDQNGFQPIVSRVSPAVLDAAPIVVVQPANPVFDSSNANNGMTSTTFFDSVSIDTVESAHNVSEVVFSVDGIDVNAIQILTFTINNVNIAINIPLSENARTLLSQNPQMGYNGTDPIVVQGANIDLQLNPAVTLNGSNAEIRLNFAFLENALSNMFLQPAANIINTASLVVMDMGGTPSLTHNLTLSIDSVQDTGRNTSGHENTRQTSISSTVRRSITRRLSLIWHLKSLPQVVIILKIRI